MGTRRRVRSDERGAAAVEFALVSSVFLVMLFGTVQYGLYFNDSLNVRQGVRESARQGVVENFEDCPGASTNSAKLICATKERIGAITGDTYVKVSVPAAGWAKGEPLSVCAMVQSDGAVGLLPMPNGGWIQSRTQMWIEQETETASWTSGEDALPSDQSWSWCS